MITLDGNEITLDRYANEQRKILAGMDDRWFHLPDFNGQTLDICAYFGKYSPTNFAFWDAVRTDAVRFERSTEIRSADPMTADNIGKLLPEKWSGEDAVVAKPPWNDKPYEVTNCGWIFQDGTHYFGINSKFVDYIVDQKNAIPGKDFTIEYGVFEENRHLKVVSVKKRWTSYSLKAGQKMYFDQVGFMMPIRLG